MNNVQALHIPWKDNGWWHQGIDEQILQEAHGCYTSAPEKHINIDKFNKVFIMQRKSIFLICLDTIVNKNTVSWENILAIA